MSSDKLKRPLVALAATAGLLTVAAPAGAGMVVGNPGTAAEVIVYNGHAPPAAIVAADFTYNEAKGSIESQYVPTSVEAVMLLHGDFSTFQTNLAHRP